MKAVQNRSRTIFPGHNPALAFDYVKTLEKILDFQSDMVAVNQDQLKKVREAAKVDSNGLGRQRLQMAQTKTINMLNSFKVDFSGQSVKVLAQIENVGQLKKNDVSFHDALETKAKSNEKSSSDNHR
jgi:cellobiose phosphorylase